MSEHDIVAELRRWIPTREEVTGIPVDRLERAIEEILALRGGRPVPAFLRSAVRDAALEEAAQAAEGFRFSFDNEPDKSVADMMVVQARARIAANIRALKAPNT